MTMAETNQDRKDRWWIYTIGVIVLTLATFTIVKSIADDRQSTRQQACFELNFSQLSTALNKRADLTKRETAQAVRVDKAEQRIWDIYAKAAGVLEDKPRGAELNEQRQKQIQEDLIAALLHYQGIANSASAKITRIQTKRAENPVPPYPKGTCD